MRAFAAAASEASAAAAEEEAEAEAEEEEEEAARRFDWGAGAGGAAPPTARAYATAASTAEPKVPMCFARPSTRWSARKAPLVVSCRTPLYPVALLLERCSRSPSACSQLQAVKRRRPHRQLAGAAWEGDLFTAAGCEEAPFTPRERAGAAWEGDLFTAAGCEATRRNQPSRGGRSRSARRPKSRRSR